MKEDQPVKCGHRAILQRFTIAIARYIYIVQSFSQFIIYCLAVFIIIIKSPSKGRWWQWFLEGGQGWRGPLLQGPGYWQHFFWYLFNSDMWRQWLSSRLTGELLDNFPVENTILEKHLDLFVQILHGHVDPLLQLPCDRRHEGWGPR